MKNEWLNVFDAYHFCDIWKNLKVNRLIFLLIYYYSHNLVIMKCCVIYRIILKSIANLVSKPSHEI